MDTEIEEEIRAAGDDPPVGAAGAALEGVDPPPPPPPASAAEEVRGAAVVDEHPVANPADAAAAAAPWYQDKLKMRLLILTGAILAFLFIVDKGINPAAWWSEFAGMTLAEWFTALFLAVGDIASLGLIFSPSGYFRQMWRREAGDAGLAALASPLAGVVNCGVWCVYGMVVKGMNVSVMIVNGTGVLFNVGYTVIFVLRSGTQRFYSFVVILVALAVAAAIFAVDYCVLIKSWGWEVPEAVGGSGAMTGSLMYAFGAVVTMMAANDNRGAGGLSAQAGASFVNALVWLAVSTHQTRDSSPGPDCNATFRMPSQFANGIGIVCFLLQGGQLTFFKFNKPRQEEETHQRLLLGEE